MKARTVVFGAVGAGAAGLSMASQRADRRAAERFYDWTGPTDASPEIDGVTSRYPGYVNRVELFGAVFGADAEAVTRALPSDDIAPVRLPGNRAAVFVGGAHYREFTMGGFEGAMPPYGEALVAAMVTRKAAPSMLPLAGMSLPVPAGWRAGMFYLYVPVTARFARDAGWTTGFPKFVADLEFEETPAVRRLRASEGGRAILDLTVPVAGQVRVTHQPMLGYTAHDGQLLEVETRAWAYQHAGVGGRGVALELGSHQVADHIRELGISGRAFATLVWPSGRIIIPPGRPVGAARAFDGFRGSERWFGRYTIRYPGTAPVDQYGYFTGAGIEQAVVRGGGRLIDEYRSFDADLGRPASVPPAVETPAREPEPVTAG